MKTALAVLILCAGCATTPVQPTPFVRTSMAQPQSVTPPATGLIGRFIYPQPLTNCWLEETIDLKRWSVVDAQLVTITTNQDKTTSWWIPADTNARMYYRVGGEPIP